jgi:hypothetical protein
MKTRPNKSLQATRDGRSSSVSQFIITHSGEGSRTDCLVEHIAQNKVRGMIVKGMRKGVFKIIPLTKHSPDFCPADLR